MENVTDDVTAISIASLTLLVVLLQGRPARRAPAIAGAALLVAALAFMASGRQILLPISAGAAGALKALAFALVIASLAMWCRFLWRTRAGAEDGGR